MTLRCEFYQELWSGSHCMKPATHLVVYTRMESNEGALYDIIALCDKHDLSDSDGVIKVVPIPQEENDGD